MNASSRERILIVAHEFTFGGAAWLALRHIRRLLSQYEIDLLVTGPCEERMLRHLPDSVSVFKLEANSRTSDLHALYPEIYLNDRETPPFQRFYRAALATSVFPDSHACIALTFVKAARKLAFLVDESLASYPRIEPQQRQIIDDCLAVVDLVVPVSRRLWQRVADECPMVSQRPWEVLRPPVDVAQILLSAREPVTLWEPVHLPVVLTVARLVRDKQVLQCLRVHHQLRAAGLEFRWYVVGVGPYETALRGEINRLKMGDAFFLVGSVENVYAWMKQCDLFALFSASEGCPTVVIEALLIGTPVIMTDVNGADELIDHERTGLIVPNDVGAMAKGLARLLTEPGLRDQFRRNLASDPAGSDEVRETAWLVEKIEQPVPSAAPVSIPPKVSILIPTYNQEHSINVAIASALMQDFPALEVIVADDASTDGTAAITRRWSSDSRFRYLRNERNIGRVANYRRALCERAEGDWVLMLDGDDYLIDPGFIRRGWEALQRHADSAPLFAQAGHRIHYVYRKRSDVDIKPLIEGSERLMTGGEYLQFVFKTGFFTHLGALYHRKSAIEHQFYRADINSSDMESLLRLALEGKVLILNTLAGCWVQHGGNASSSLPLSQIPVNVRIFRQITRLAVQRGLVSWPEIAPALIHYEVGTLIHLLDRAAGKTMRGLLDLYRAPAVVISIDPRLLLNHQLLRFWPRYFWRLFQLSFERCLSSLAGWKAFKKPRPDKP